MKDSYTYREIIQLLTACCSECGFDNGLDITKLQIKYEGFLLRHGLLPPSTPLEDKPKLKPLT
jgi:hypothetical protein